MVSINNLIKVSNKLDKKGFHQYSNIIDAIIRKVAYLQEQEMEKGLEEEEDLKESDDQPSLSINDFFDNFMD